MLIDNHLEIFYNRLDFKQIIEFFFDDASKS